MNIREMRESLDIFQKYSDNDDGAPVFGGADHDVIYSNFSDNIPADSDDGKKLIKLGWNFSTQYDCWVLRV